MVLPLLVLVALGAAEDSVHCRERFEALQFRAATVACRAELAHALPGRLPELYRMLAISLATVGDEAGARIAFESLLVLEPNFSLPASVSPRFRQLLGGARRPPTTQPASVRLQPQTPAYDDAPLEVRVTLDDGPAHPAQRLEVSAGAQRRELLARDVSGPVVFAPPRQTGRLELHVDAVDGLGGVLLSSDSELWVQPRFRPRPWPLSWKVWGASAVAFGGVGLGFGLATRASNLKAESDHFASDVVKDLHRARNEAITADAAYGVAGALAVGSLVLLLTEHREAR